MSHRRNALTVLTAVLIGWLLVQISATAPTSAQGIGEMPALLPTPTPTTTDEAEALMGSEAWYVLNGYTEAPPAPGASQATHRRAAPASAFPLFLPLVVRAKAAPTPTPSPTPTQAPTPTPSPTPLPPPTEFRALWVTRYDWTQLGQVARPETLVTIAERAQAAGFNVLLFQVRGTGDAYYTPGLEPWAARLTGTAVETLGKSPGFDPLQTLIEAAHARGLQVHAYVNVYPTWVCGYGAPPKETTPQHPFWTFSYATSWKDWRVHDSQGRPMNLQTCSGYLWATPAWSGVRQHVVDVVDDLMRRYELDGVHLDLVRYPGPGYSYDPYTPTDFATPEERTDWQREQVNRLVQEVYATVKRHRPQAWITAAVWGMYRDVWGWGGFSQGYTHYYQDSKRWLREGWVDAIMPMLYPPNPQCPDTSVWTLDRFRVLVEDFQREATSAGRYVFPGIHAGYPCFDDVRNRVEAARELGTRGYALFSYGTANARDHWDEIATQLHAKPLAVPPVP